MCIIHALCIALISATCLTDQHCQCGMRPHPCREEQHCRWLSHECVEEEEVELEYRPPEGDGKGGEGDGGGERGVEEGER